MPTYIVDKRYQLYNYMLYVDNMQDINYTTICCMLITYNSNILHFTNSKMHLIFKKYFPNQVAFHIYTQDTYS